MLPLSTWFTCAVFWTVVTVQIVHGTVNVYPVDKNGPKCYGTNNDPITGGLFGIAVALSSGKDSGGITYMAVGRPMDDSVSIYYTPSPVQSVPLITSTCPNPNGAYPPVIVTNCVDTANVISGVNYTVTKTYYNCYAVNGTFIPVCKESTGVPTLNGAPQYTPVDWTYWGSDNTPVYDATSGGVAWDTVNNMRAKAAGFNTHTTGSGTLARWNHFGRSLDLSYDGKYMIVGAPGKTLDSKYYSGSWYLYIQNVPSGKYIQLAEFKLNGINGYTSNNFLDKFGHKVSFSKDINSTFVFAAASGGYEGKYGRTPSSYLNRMGVYVYKRVNFGTMTSTSNYVYLQFLNLVTPFSFGVLGLDFTVMGETLYNMHIAIRDYKIVELTNYTGSGLVQTYQYNGTLFVKTGNIQAYDLGSTGNFMREDYFGRGLAMGYDPISNQTLLTIGAPLEALKLYNFQLNTAATWSGNVSQTGNLKTLWSSGPIIYNDQTRASSWFGGTQHMTSDGRYLFVGDAINPNNGQGSVYIYRRYLANENVKGFESVPPPTSLNPNGPTWYKIGQYVKNTLPAPVNYTLDQFGTGITSNWWLTVVGAPVEECVYTFPVPFSWAGIATLNNNSYAAPPVPSPTTITTTLGSSSSTDDSLRVGIIAGVIALLVILPIFIFIIIRWQKRKLLKRLEELKAAENLANKMEKSEGDGPGANIDPTEMNKTMPITPLAAIKENETMPTDQPSVNPLFQGDGTGDQNPLFASSYSNQGEDKIDDRGTPSNPLFGSAIADRSEPSNVTNPMFGQNLNDPAPTYKETEHEPDAAAPVNPLFLMK